MYTLLDKSQPGAGSIKWRIVTATCAFKLYLKLPLFILGHELAGAQLSTGTGDPQPHDAMPQVFAATRCIFFLALVIAKPAQIKMSAEQKCITMRFYMLKNFPLLALLALGDVRSAAGGISFLRLKILENTVVSDLICASNALGIRPYKMER